MNVKELIAASKEQYGVALNLVHLYTEGVFLSVSPADAVCIFVICNQWKNHFEEEYKKDKTLYETNKLVAELHRRIVTRFFLKEKKFLEYGKKLDWNNDEETKNFRIVAGVMKNFVLASNEWKNFANNPLFAK